LITAAIDFDTLLQEMTGSKISSAALTVGVFSRVKHIRMKKPYFRARTVDDLLRHALKDIEKYGEPIKASKGQTREITGVVLELTNPRARLSRTESRGKPFSCIGELCWYFNGTDETSFIVHYLTHYKKADEGGHIFGAYGPRLFKRWKSVKQFENIIKLLREKPTSRRAVLQLFDSADLAQKHEDVPCTCTLQLLVRNGKLDLIVYMRSNDVIKGLTHDIFCFTMLQEIAARRLSVELGTYRHCVGSLHLYSTDDETAKSFLLEGWQPTKSAMPAMPVGDPSSEIRLLLKAEAALRRGEDRRGQLPEEEKADPYWADLIRLLRVFRYRRLRNKRALGEIRQKMTFPIYDTYIKRALDGIA
jgi:thymidylate synthase